MKKIFLLFSISVLVALGSHVFAQKAFEGTITYGIEYEDLPEEMEAMKSMLPSETIIRIKDSKTRTEQSMGMGSTISIYDRKDNTSVTLMDMMGSKVAIKMNPKDEKKAKKEAKVLDIKYLDETKEIAGYKCKKAEITLEGEEETIIVYYTEEINTQETKAQYKGLKGFPMSYEINTPEMKMVMTVKEVKKEKVSSAEFTVPAEYEEMTMEEFQAKMSESMMGE